jgi:hypothetical protein
VEDVQSRHDDRQVPIDQVGVCDLRYPITVLDRQRVTQQTMARLTMSVLGGSNSFPRLLGTDRPLHGETARRVGEALLQLLLDLPLQFRLIPEGRNSRKRRRGIEACRPP